MGKPHSAISTVHFVVLNGLYSFELKKISAVNVFDGVFPSSALGRPILFSLPMTNAIFSWVDQAIEQCLPLVRPWRRPKGSLPR